MSTSITPSFVISSVSNPENPLNGVRRSLDITTRFGKTFSFQTTSQDKIKDMRDEKQISKHFLKSELSRFLTVDKVEEAIASFLDFSKINEDGPKVSAKERNAALKIEMDNKNREILAKMTPEQREQVKAANIFPPELFN